MARWALDPEERNGFAEPWFGKGDGYLAECLGYPPGDESGQKRAREARKVLRDLGYIEPPEKSRPTSHKRRWVLTLPDSS